MKSDLSNIVKQVYTNFAVMTMPAFTGTADVKYTPTRANDGYILSSAGSKATVRFMYDNANPVRYPNGYIRITNDLGEYLDFRTGQAFQGTAKQANVSRYTHWAPGDFQGNWADVLPGWWSK